MNSPIQLLCACAGLAFLPIFSGCDEEEDVVFDVQVSSGAQFQHVDMQAMTLELYSASGQMFVWADAIESFSVQSPALLSFGVGPFRLPSGEYSGVAMSGSKTAGEVVSDNFAYALQRTETQLVTPIDFNLSPSQARAILRLDLQLSIWDRRTSYGDFQLQPHLSLVHASNAATLGGSVQANVLGSNCDAGAMVYLFDGLDASLHDEWRGVLASVVASSAVVHGNDGGGQFDFGSLNAGGYTLALTCDGEYEHPNQNDALSFTRLGSFRLLAGENHHLSFPLSDDGESS